MILERLLLWLRPIGTTLQLTRLRTGIPSPIHSTQPHWPDLAMTVSSARRALPPRICSPNSPQVSAAVTSPPLLPLSPGHLSLPTSEGFFSFCRGQPGLVLLGSLEHREADVV